MLRVLPTVAVALAFSLVLALPAAAVDVNPGDFSVSISSGLPQPSFGLPFCSTADATGASTCTIEGTVSGTASSLAGAATQLSTGRSGSLTASCDWQGSYSATATVNALRQIALQALSGTVSQSCSWQVTVGSSSLVGTMSGSGALGVGGPTTVSYDGMLTVVVAGGTGEFAGMVGSGSFEHKQEVELPPIVARHLARASDDLSTLSLTLTQGKPRVLIAAPGARITASTDQGLRVVSIPGSTCSALARSGARSVSLGHATDAKRDGLVVVRAKLLPLLARGSWRLAVKCAYSGGSATASVALVVG